MKATFTNGEGGSLLVCGAGFGMFVGCGIGLIHMLAQFALSYAVIAAGLYVLTTGRDRQPRPRTRYERRLPLLPVFNRQEAVGLLLCGAGFGCFAGMWMGLANLLLPICASATLASVGTLLLWIHSHQRLGQTEEQL